MDLNQIQHGDFDAGEAIRALAGAVITLAQQVKQLQDQLEKTPASPPAPTPKKKES